MRVTVTAAPEPDEVLWTNLEVSDRVMAQRMLQAYAVILLLVVVTLASVLILKLAMADVALSLSAAIRSQGRSFDVMLARGTTLGVTALVATATVTWPSTPGPPSPTPPPPLPR